LLAHVWPGALLAAVLFEIAKAGFATYLAHFARYQVVYGSLGGVIALLFWVYISANILLYGAEVAAEYGHLRRGEPRHGHAFADDGDWRASLLSMLRGLVFAPSDDGPANEPGR
jgi:membrane protein